MSHMHVQALRCTASRGDMLRHGQLADADFPQQATVRK